MHEGKTMTKAGIHMNREHFCMSTVELVYENKSV